MTVSVLKTTALAAVLALLSASVGLAQDQDIDILKRALTNSLGEKTNSGALRVASVKKEVRRGGETLLIVLNANNGPTPAAVRYGIFTDAVKVFKILKSWEWPDRVERVVLGEQCLTGDGSSRKTSELVFMGQISSDKVRETDWESFNPGKIPDIMDSVQFRGAAEKSQP